MKRYYIVSPSIETGVIEVTEAEVITLIGTDETRPYASQVYRGLLSIEDVPEDLRAQVQTVVDSKIARFGEYNKQEIPASELNNMIEEVL